LKAQRVKAELHLFFIFALNGVEGSESHTNYFNFHSPQYSPNKRLGGSHIQPAYFGEE
jgi:hypothetical protein